MSLVNSIQKYSFYRIIALTLCYIISVSVSCALDQSKLIMLKKKREQIIDSADSVLNPGNKKFDEILETITNPFEAFEEEIEEIEEEVDEDRSAIPEEVEEPEPEVNKLDDDEVLKIFAKSLNPTGTMILGNQKIMLLRNGKAIKIGDTIPTTIKDEDYLVEVDDIKDDSFTLKLNYETLSIKIYKIEPKGKAIFEK